VRKLRGGPGPCYEPGVRARPWALCGWTLLAMGCVIHRGPWRLDPEPAKAIGTTADPEGPPAKQSASDGVDLVLLANVSPEDRGARAVAARVEQVLATDRPRLVLWLGNVAAAPMVSATLRAERRGPRCAALEDAWAGPAAAALVGAVERSGGERSFAVPGVLDHRCGHTAALQTGQPWQMPGSHYVLRVHADGAVTQRAACGDTGCTFDHTAALPSEAPPLVDLVVIDLAPWLHPSDDPTARRHEERRVHALEALLTAVAAVPAEAAPPRLLVSSVPVEAAGEHGLGALWPDATFHGLPPHLQALLIEGGFAGVLAGHDRSLYATADLTDAIKRADRAWLRTPVFEVVAGAVSAPNRRAGMALRPRRLRTSQAFAPPVWSDHAGFAVVHVRGEDAELVLHARRRRHWESTSLRVSLRPVPHPSHTPSPHMAPCRDCPPIPASER